ncbi:hypothetical protein ACN28S_22870 [Cystobacter fuscus]
MNRPWQRQRQPDDVPTPVAVAVSDYCRRAHSPATPTEVREALALLAESDDFRVRSLTDAEPGATPLGPFAVIDVLQGTAPELAATRQGCGYYDVVRELARVHEEKRPPAPPPAPEVPSFALPPARPVPARPEVAPASAGETVQSRIAPRKRPAAESLPPRPTSTRPPASSRGICPSPAAASPAWRLPRRATRSCCAPRARTRWRRWWRRASTASPCCATWSSSTTARAEI